MSNASPSETNKVADIPFLIVPYFSIPNILAQFEVSAFIASSYGNPCATAVPARNGIFLLCICSISP